MSGSGRLVAWFGRGYFAGSLEKAGWRVFLNSYHKPRVFTWRDITDLCGEPPDVLVLGDRSHPPAFLGLESYPCLTVFYSVDSHIHSWHPFYAQAFDACLVGLKDDLPKFKQDRLDDARILWSPAYALNAEEMPWKPVAPEWDILFTGTVDPETTPGRAAFLKRLAGVLPGLHVTRGYFLDMFPTGRIILNVAERGDLNFRVFEALAMQKPLLTPRTGNGLLDLFEDGRDLLTYAPDDEHDCAAKARWLLEHPVEAQAMAKAGFEKVDAGHRQIHRALACGDFLTARLACGFSGRLADAGLIHKTVLRPLHLHWAEAIPDPGLKAAYLADARRP